MLIVGSKLLGYPVLSLHVGGEIARTEAAIINPEGLKVVAYTLNGPVLKNQDVGNILEISDVRELSPRGMIVDSSDDFVIREDIIRLDEVMKLNFRLVGLRVVSQDGKKLGKVSDYTVDSGSFMIYQIIVQRPAMKALLDPELTINRSQIVEIDDYQITIKNEEEKVEVKAKAKDFTPNFVNPFREPNYASKDSEDKAS
ncbi:MAG: PRC-barrel domain-containing protein [Candidatus Saccharimonadales bacterium]